MAESKGLRVVKLPSVTRVLSFLKCALGAVAQESLSEKRAYLIRDFPFREKGILASIIVDACPWGIGGVLLWDGVPVRYFRDTISVGDIGYLEVEIGECRYQNVFELLAILVAVRNWSHLVPQNLRVVLWSDSVVAIQSALKWRGQCERLNKIVLELAFEAALDNTWLDMQYQHIAGRENLWADALSRSARGASLPEELVCVTETPCQSRDSSFWKMRHLAEDNENGPE